MVMKNSHIIIFIGCAIILLQIRMLMHPAMQGDNGNKTGDKASSIAKSNRQFDAEAQALLHAHDEAGDHHTPCPSTLAPQKCPPCPKLKQKETKAPLPVTTVAPEPLYRMKVIVFTYNRLPGLKRLLTSLANANYVKGQPVDLHVFCDFPKNSKGMNDAHKKLPLDTREYLDKFKWNHGRFYQHRREINVGLKRSILEAWYPTSDDEVAAFFEDDIEVSPMWYEWADKALKTYVFNPEHPPDEKLLGLSLFRPIHDELSGRGSVVKNNHKPFVLQQPCSWGAVYLPKLWRNFRNWYDEEGNVHGEPVLKDPNDPGVDPSSNTWPSGSSWKKYLIKHMYEEGWFMVYPNLPEKMVLATNHLMKGEHPTPPKKLFELPLLEDSSGVDHDVVLDLPPIKDMKAFDVMFRKTSDGTVETLPNYKN